MAKISDRLRKAIQDAKQSRYQIAHASGVDAATLCRFVKGQRGLSMEAIDALADYFQLGLVKRRGK